MVGKNTWFTQRINQPNTMIPVFYRIQCEYTGPILDRRYKLDIPQFLTDRPIVSHGVHIILKQDTQGVP